jgi:SAM-dependent methyltransferase
VSAAGTRYWDAVAYEWTRSGSRRLWRAHSDAVNGALLVRWLPAEPVEHILKTDAFDEAVAAGLYPLLASRAFRVTAVDVSQPVLDAARRRYPKLETVKADARKLPFEAETFDAIVSNSTLDHFEHHEHIAEALRELARVLRPGGTLLVTLDNPVNPVVAVRNHLPFRPVRLVPFSVGATCSPKRLRRMLGEAGFAVAEIDAIMHCPRLLAVPLAGVLEGRARQDAHRRYLGLLNRFEFLGRLPTSILSGHFVAAKARKPA